MIIKIISVTIGSGISVFLLIYILFKFYSFYKENVTKEEIQQNLIFTYSYDIENQDDNSFSENSYPSPIFTNSTNSYIPQINRSFESSFSLSQVSMASYCICM